MEWFESSTNNYSQPQPQAKRILIFNCSHERNPLELLSIIKRGGFSDLYFCRNDFNRPSPIPLPTARQVLEANNVAVHADLLEVAAASSETTSWQETMACLWKHLLRNDGDDHQCEIVCNLNTVDALQLIQQQQVQSSLSSPVEVLVTGSLYLVGSVLDAVGWSEESSSNANVFLDV
jgi:hypothetical protein